MKLTRAQFMLVIVGLVPTTPGYSQNHGSPLPYACSVYQESVEGTWRASRNIVEANGSATATPDIYEWQPNEAITFGPGMRLRWDIVYNWPADIGPRGNVPETEIMLDMHFAFDAQNGGAFKKPDRSWLHFYRSVDTEKGRHILATSLSTMTLWHQYGAQRLSTRAIISLDDLLAFGTGHDTLAWDIRSPPDMFGGTKMIAKGYLPIGPMRGKVADILKLRKLLDKKAANFHKQCQILPVAPLSAPPLG